MPYFVDKSGKVWEYPDNESGFADGMSLAGDADIAAHNRALDAEEEAKRQEDLGWVGRRKEDLLGAVVGFGRTLSAGMNLVGAGDNTFTRSFQTPEARQLVEQHPLSSGFGQAAALGPLAELGGAAAGAMFGFARVGAGAAAAAGEGLGMGAAELAGGSVARAGTGLLERAAGAAVEELGAGTAAGVAQEYSDAWFEGRDLDLKNAAQNTLMFASAGGVLRGLGFGARAALRGLSKEAVTEAETAVAAEKGSLFERPQESIISRAARWARKEQGAPAESTVKGMTVDDAPAFEEVAKRALNELDAPKAAAIALKREELLQLSAVEASHRANELLSAVTDEFGVGTKQQLWARGAAEWGPQELEQQAALIGEDVVARGTGLIGAISHARKSGYEFKGLGNAIADKVRQSLGRIKSSSDLVQRNIEIDGLKRVMQMADKSIGRSAASGSIDAASAGRLQGLVSDYAGTLVKVLENEQAFGANARFQQKINPVWEKLLEAFSVLEGPGGFVGRGPEEYGVLGAARRPRVTTASDMLRFLSGDTVQTAETRNAFKQMVEAFDGMAKVHSEFGSLETSTIDDLRRSAFALRKEQARADLIATAAKHADELRAKDATAWQHAIAVAKRGGAGALGGIVGNFLGGPVAGGIGSAVAASAARFGTSQAAKLEARGAVWDLLDDGIRSYARLPELQDAAFASRYSSTVQQTLKDYGAPIAQVTGRQVVKPVVSKPSLLGRAVRASAGAAERGLAGSDDVLRAAGDLLPFQRQLEPPDTFEALDAVGGVPTAPYAGRSVDASAALKTVADAGAALIQQRARELVGGGAVKSEDAYTSYTNGEDAGAALERVRGLMEQLRSDGPKFLQSVAASLGDVHTTHPRLQQELSAQAINIVGYLNEQLPRRAGASPWFKGYPLNAEETHEFAMKAIGVLFPRATIRDIAAGAADPRQVTAFKQNWPALFFQLAQETAGELQRRGEAGHPIDPERMRQIDQLLDLDGAGDRALSWRVAELMEYAKNVAQQQPRTPRRMSATAGSLADNFATRRAERRMRRS